MFGLGFAELIFIVIVAILLFGRNLPDVARSLGRMYRDFRSGISEFTKDFDLDLDGPPNSSRSSSSYRAPKTYNDYDDYEDATAPKFEPPKSEPREETPPQDTQS